MINRVLVLDEDDEIRVLKKQLDGLKRDRLRKTVHVEKRNQQMVQRDAKRHEYFLANFKTEAQLAAEAAARRAEELAKMLEMCVQSEDDDRGALEEEESLEFRLHIYDHHLSVICVTVAVVTAEHERREHQLRLVLEERERRVMTQEKIKQAFVRDALEARRQLERTEGSDFRDLGSKFKAGAEIAERRERQRVEAADAAVRAAAEKLELEKRNRAIREVDEAEEEYLLQLSKVDNAFKRMLENSGGKAAV